MAILKYIKLFAISLLIVTPQTNCMETEPEKTTEVHIFHKIANNEKFENILKSGLVSRTLDDENSKKLLKRYLSCSNFYDQFFQKAQQFKKINQQEKKEMLALSEKSKKVK